MIRVRTLYSFDQDEATMIRVRVAGSLSNPPWGLYGSPIIPLPAWHIPPHAIPAIPLGACGSMTMSFKS